MAFKIGSKVRRRYQKEDYYGIITEFPQRGIANVRFPGGLAAVGMSDLVRNRRRKK